LRGEDFAIDAIDERAAIEGRHGDGERGFGEAVDGKLRGGAEAVGGEALGETLESFGIDGLGAIEGGAPGAEIEADDVFVGYFADAKFVGEIGRCGNRAAMFVYGPEPAFRAGEEGERGHYGEGDAVEQQREPGADKAHIVIKREPAYADVVASKADGFADGAHVSEQIGVRQDHAFGIAGRAGSVLQERDV